MAMPRSRPSAGWLVVVMAVVLLPAAYVGSYLALMDQRHTSTYLMGPPPYLVGGKPARLFFYPAYYVDSRFVRPESWMIVEVDHWLEKW